MLFIALDIKIYVQVVIMKKDIIIKKKKIIINIKIVIIEQQYLKIIY